VTPDDWDGIDGTDTPAGGHGGPGAVSDPAPTCPECGEPIGQTATYCMHCSADLTGERSAADADGDGAWDDGGAAGDGAERGDGPETGDADVPWESGGGGPDPTWGPDGEGGGAGGDATSPSSVGGDGDSLLDPDGLVDNSLTVVVGIAGGLVVGFVGTIALAVMTESGWGFLLGILAWLGSTAYLVRQRTVQGAVEKSGYAVAVVLLLLPLIAFSPLAAVDGGLTGRATFFVFTLVAVAVPASVAAGLGYVAGRFVPDGVDESDEPDDADETPA
jgi:hypothetical protein